MAKNKKRQSSREDKPVPRSFSRKSTNSHTAQDYYDAGDKLSAYSLTRELRGRHQAAVLGSTEGAL